jgi:hypothetical protein
MSAPFLFAMESLVDVVVCQLDKPVAAAKMRRAVVKGGRSAVATSRSDDEIPLMRERSAVSRNAAFHEVWGRTAFAGESAPVVAALAR